MMKLSWSFFRWTDLKAKLYILTEMRKVGKLEEISMFNRTLDLDGLKTHLPSDRFNKQ